MQYHDVLANLDITNAHPGGTAVTNLWMGYHLFSTNDMVLDVGCGNGATACAIAQLEDVKVTAIDVRRKMVENTINRARRENVRIQTAVASAEELPIPDNSFDWVVCESVLVFVNADRVLREFARVLKPSGQVLSVEMQKLHAVPDSWDREVKNIYGAVSVPDFVEWKRRHALAGFSTKVLQSGPIRQMPIEMAQTSGPVPQSVWTNPDVIRILEANGQWLERNQHTLGYGVFVLKNLKSEL